MNVPKLYGKVTVGDTHYILMEFIESVGRLQSDGLYETLKKVYSIKGELWGWGNDNFIGSIYQKNSLKTSFTSFWWEDRIKQQSLIAEKKGLIPKQTISTLENLVKNSIEYWNLEERKPCVIHGDLWSGNVLQGKNGKVYLIDPCISYSNPEQDIGMAKMFGGFPSEWIAKIEKDFGFPSGLSKRIPFWQLYPVLVHVNIFGRGYLSSLESTIRLLSNSL